MVIHAHGPSPKGLFCNAGAGAAAGVIAATFVCPLDVIKTRLQVHGLPQISNSSVKGSVIVGSLEHTFQKEGFRGMYRGLSPTVLALLPNGAVYFTIYEQLKSFLGADDLNHHLSVDANMLAASGAGAATRIATNLLWVVKTRFQTQEMSRGMCYTGAHCLPSEELHMRRVFEDYTDNTTVDKLSVSDIAVTSSVSKIFASTLTYPHEVVRSRLQEQGHHSEKRYCGVVNCIKKVFQQDGFPGFYRGCATNLLRTTPAAVITFTSFEMIHRFLVNLFPPDPQSL